MANAAQTEGSIKREGYTTGEERGDLVTNGPFVEQFRELSSYNCTEYELQQLLAEISFILWSL